MTSRIAIPMTCPDCDGPISELREDGAPVTFECLVGHVHSTLSILSGHSDRIEWKLWAAVLALEESEVLVKRLAPEIESADLRVEILRVAEENKKHAQAVREILEQLSPLAVSEESER